MPRLATPAPGSGRLGRPRRPVRRHLPGRVPGGWLLVGRTDLVLFDVHADPPARLGPGAQVRMAAA
ncbi:hypothetical protein GCM10027614_47560 [Micromonospora vulcania]